jgi:hypothetical protein
MDDSIISPDRLSVHGTDNGIFQEQPKTPEITQALPENLYISKKTSPFPP